MCLLLKNHTVQSDLETVFHQVLQELGILTDANGRRRIKRIAGASAGAMLASLLAVGLEIDDIDELLNQNIKAVLEGILNVLNSLSTI